MVPEPKPRELATELAAAAAVMVVPAGACSITDCTKVVKGLINRGWFKVAAVMAGAFRSTVLAIPVSMLTPPLIVIAPESAWAAVKKNVPSDWVLIPVSTPLM